MALSANGKEDRPHAIKGFGHGVRKIQSAGKSQAVIIHTATGRHLAELKAESADVGCSSGGEETDDSIE